MDLFLTIAKMEELSKQMDLLVYSTQIKKTDIEKQFGEEWTQKWLDFIKNNDELRPYFYDGHMSGNINVTMETIENHPEIPWNHHGVCLKPDVTLDFMFEHLNENLNWLSISSHVTLDVILKYPDLPWNRVGITINPNVTMDDIMDNPELPWDFNMISPNPNFDINTILDYTPEIIQHHSNKDMFWLGVSLHPKLILDVFLEKKEIPWNWNYVSNRDDITTDIILKYCDLPWNWSILSVNKNISLKFIQEHPEMPWNWNVIGCRSDVTMEFIKEHPEKQWDWKSICKNPNVTIGHIATNRKLWNWDNLIKNKNLSTHDIITFTDYAKYTKYNRPWTTISEHINLTIDFVEKHPYLPWDYRKISIHSFEYDKQYFISHKQKQLSVVMIHEQLNDFEFYDENKPYSLIELILSDSYLVNLLTKY